MDFKIKPIKTDEDYKEALKRVEDLMDEDPEPGSEEGEQLNLLATLIKDYESNVFSDSVPDPVEAILFRMEQQGLKPADLAPYLGCASRVSEILSRKRSLTVEMMRKLEAGLGIPAKVLLKKSDDFGETSSWNKYPIKEMKQRGYFENIKNHTTQQLIENFFQPIGAASSFVGMLRKTYYRSKKPVDKYALA